MSTNRSWSTPARRRLACAKALRHRVDQLQREHLRELSKELERWIEETVRAEFEQLVPRFERVIAGQSTESQRRYANRIERILDEVQDIAQDVFGARARDALPDTGLRAPSRFSFKPHATRNTRSTSSSASGGRSLRKLLRRRLVLHDADQRLQTA